MNETTDAILRCYIDNGKIPKPDDKNVYYDKNTLFIFDTETTNDIYQNLLYGYYCVWDLQSNKIRDRGLFYGEVLTKSQIKILEDYSKSHKIKLMARNNFVSTLVDWIYYRRSICSGFNIPYDLTRICVDFSTSKRDHDGFSIRLSNDRFMPRLFIKSLSSRRAFINFIVPYFRNRRKKHNYLGRFCDLRTLSFAASSKSLSLEKACELFDTKHKKSKIDEYGEVSNEAIQYCINDVDCCFDLYKALIKDLEKYGIPLDPTKLASPASIGKQYFKCMHLESFFQRNPLFDKSKIGIALTCYYGARTEVHIRKKPVKISYMDIFSTYPLQWVLQDLNSLCVATETTLEEDPWFPNFIQNVKLEDLTNKEIWKSFKGFCLIETDSDILPLRARYGGKLVPNISLNNISGKQLWYAYPDVVASKILSGKVPKIIKSYKYVIHGKQTLKPVKLFGKIIDENTDFIKMLIEHRLEVKEKLKQNPDDERLKNEYLTSKIVANSTSYGIWVEASVTAKPGKVNIWGLENYEKEVSRTESYGKVFNPLISISLTSGARLCLSMCEAFIKQHNGYFAMMDTDSVFAGPTDVIEPLKAYFKNINPFSKDVDIIKVEEGYDKKPLTDVYLYGISSKRYCCFSIENNDVRILRHSSHGLGYISSMPKNWEIEFWKDIVKYHYGMVTKEDIENKYKHNVVASKLTITSPFLLRRFKQFNSKDITHRIRPFNFVIVGTQCKIDETTKSAVVPLLPFTKDYSTIKYQPFVDCKTGKYYETNTQLYWRSISDLFFQYIDHREQKYDDSESELKRKDIFIRDIRYVGKETSSNLDETEVIGIQDDDYIFYDKDSNEKLQNVLQNLTKDQAKSYGMSKWQYNYIKRCLKQDKVPKLKKKTLRLLGLL